MVKVATREGKMAVVREHAFLCNADGVKMINDDFANEGVNHIMIAACSRRAKTEAFYFPHVAMARANIREGMIWSQPDTDAAYDQGADMIVTSCPLCQANVEVYQADINKREGTKLSMPVTYYSQFMTVAYGGSAKEAGLDGHIIQPKKLQELAGRK